MQPLTPHVWHKHFTELRPHVLEAFPEVDRQKLEAVHDDFEGLVSLIQDATGFSADLARQSLRKLDVDELGLGAGHREPQPDAEASLAQLRLGDGFAEHERQDIVERLQKLERRLAKFPAEGTDMELSVKDRETNSQKVTLECWLPKFPHLVAVSKQPALEDALNEIREELWSQIDEAVNRRKDAAQSRSGPVR
jgi:ribosome-associated translation inhibitor RaiA